MPLRLSRSANLRSDQRGKLIRGVMNGNRFAAERAGVNPATADVSQNHPGNLVLRRQLVQFQLADASLAVRALRGLGHAGLPKPPWLGETLAGPQPQCKGSVLLVPARLRSLAGDLRPLLRGQRPGPGLPALPAPPHRRQELRRRLLRHRLGLFPGRNVQNQLRKLVHVPGALRLRHAPIVPLRGRPLKEGRIQTETLPPPSPACPRRAGPVEWRARTSGG